VDIAVEMDEPGRELSADLLDIRDPAGFEKAYERYRLPVYRYLRARVIHDEDALDLTATTFERAFAKRASFHPRGGGLGAWLFRIARNAAIDAQRRTRREVLGAAPAVMDHQAMAGDRDAEARREVVDAVAALPPDQRDMVWLRYAGGLTAREIGTVVGKSEAAVQKQIQRALGALREGLDGLD
jgi:RNA polymerase sigma-70 factor (ECF subfamily)